MAAVYDLCIVGAGMVGSAAARHATLASHGQTRPRVCLVGPLEPETKNISSPRTIYGGHYDEGRIARELDPNVTCSTLASASIQRYRDIEKASGVKFFSELGFLVGGTDGIEFLGRISLVKEKNGLKNTRLFCASETNKEFPYFNFGERDVMFYQAANSGHISARGMVKAQQTAATLQGCDVIHDVVVGVTEIEREGRDVMQVKTDNGKTVLARKVLLATSGYTNLCDLLPRGITLDLRPYPTCVVFVEISEESADKLSGMPPVTYHGDGAGDWRPEPGELYDTDMYGFYMLPPIQYPDGRFYIKLGCLNKLTPQLATIQDMKTWHCTPPPQDVVHNMASLLTSVVKDIDPLSITGDTCITVYTATGLPYIDQISTNLTVAVGGNGNAAKSSDEIGRLGMELALYGKWNSTLAQELFKIRAVRSKL